MTSDRCDGQATATSDLHRALLAVSEAIVAHRDLSALFHELAGRLHLVVQFDGLSLVLHEAVSNTMRLHVLRVLRAVDRAVAAKTGRQRASRDKTLCCCPVSDHAQAAAFGHLADDPCCIKAVIGKAGQHGLHAVG